MSELIKLAERFEQASGPDRELDYRIGYALGWRFNGFEWPGRQSCDQEELSDQQFADLDMMAGGWKRPDQDEWPYPGTNNNVVPRWSSSIDAAMTLVPEGQLFILYSDGSCEIGPQPTDGSIMQPVAKAEAATPALALCSAALRARSVQEEGDV